MRTYSDEELRERLWTISERGFLTRGPWCGVPRAYAEEISRIEDAEWNSAIEAAAKAVHEFLMMVSTYGWDSDPVDASDIEGDIRQLRRPE